MLSIKADGTTKADSSPGLLRSIANNWMYNFAPDLKTFKKGMVVLGMRCFSAGGDVASII